MDMEQITREQIRAIRFLSDGDLVRFLTEVSQYGWVKALEFLNAKMREDQHG